LAPWTLQVYGKKDGLIYCKFLAYMGQQIAPMEDCEEKWKAGNYFSERILSPKILIFQEQPWNNTSCHYRVYPKEELESI
jgi:hypothetical protein